MMGLSIDNPDTRTGGQPAHVSITKYLEYQDVLLVTEGRVRDYLRVSSIELLHSSRHLLQSLEFAQLKQDRLVQSHDLGLF